MSVRLITVDPESVVAFCKAHPVDLKPDWRAATQRGGAGDVMPPTPAADAFFTLYLEVNKGHRLPTQQEYADYCCDVWSDWFTGYLTRFVQQCFVARLYRNFYPSFVDSVHVWALLGTRYAVHGHLVFDHCVLDTYEDVIQNSDLLVYRGEECLRIALRSQTRQAREDAWYKQTHRQPHRVEDGERLVHLSLPIDVRARVGGKCWFQWPVHFKPIFRKVEQLWLPGMAFE
jgi:hypothetical protein